MTDKAAVTLRPAIFPQDAEVVIELFAAYAKSLEIDLSFQNFEEELASVPGKYAPTNGGSLFLACVSHPSSEAAKQSALSLRDGQVIGCAALRAFNPPRTCEIKRLYVTPESRGLGAGRMLLEAIIERAKEFGYKEMLLDTLPSMVEARKMYKSFGFEEVENYYESPIAGTCFMRLTLE